MARVEPLITVVVPCLNALHHLRRSVPTMVAAARNANGIGVEVLCIDNGSTDGSVDYLRSVAPDLLRVMVHRGTTISEIRNWGAQQGRGELLSFIDADVAVDDDYFREALRALHRNGADATGCEYALPPSPHWLEKTLFDLHYVGREREVLYINAGNFIVRRAAFDAVGGFREDLPTGEDADLGHRLVARGFRIVEAPQVRGIHHGNPRSLREHFRRTTWHALGMFATVNGRRIDRPTAMLAMHLLATILGVVWIVTGEVALTVRILTAVLLQLAAPGLTVMYRMLQTRRVPNLASAVLVYWIYYWARIHALVLLATGSRSYRK